MKIIKHYKIRKCSDIELDSAYYEILDEQDHILFDIIINETNEMELSFYEDCVGKTLTYNMINKILDEIKTMADY